MRDIVELRDWGREQFGHAELGHARRTERAVTLACRAARRPAGKISEVFEKDADRQAAYDFLEGTEVPSEGLIAALGTAAARQCADHPFAYVAVDGSSLNLADRRKKKDFGAVGRLLVERVV
jgi:hypothetical protein